MLDGLTFEHNNWLRTKDRCIGDTIQGNYFFDCTAAGIIVGRSAHLVASDPASQTQRNSNNVVSDNVVRNTGSDFT